MNKPVTVQEIERHIQHAQRDFSSLKAFLTILNLAAIAVEGDATQRERLPDLQVITEIALDLAKGVSRDIDNIEHQTHLCWLDLQEETRHEIRS